MDLPQNYDPKEAEPRLQKFWEEKEIFVFHPDKKKQTYSIDTPPPTVSGKMHMGHAFSYTQQDIIARYQRMRGKNVFFPFGTDDNGLPTERLVESKRKILSTRMSRSDFVKICNEVIEQEKPIFIQSWKDIGMSADFKRSYSTINQHCQITSQASFIDLFEKGRIYQQESPISWCVACQTAIAQAEFENIEMASHFNNIIFECGAKEIVIATTRPELLPACVALFYNPKDKRYQNLKGKMAKVPLFDYEVPILSDESVDQEKGTGLIMVCTFGDKEDIDKWHRFKLPLRVVFEKYGKMNALSGPFQNLPIKEARKAIIEELKKKNLLVTQKEIVHAVNVHERCKTELEFLKTKQWYIKILDQKENLLSAANKITWHPQHMKVRYEHWVQNLNWDWCISRQRHFGIPIPVWTCTKCGTYLIANKKDLPCDPTTTKPKQKCKCGSLEFKGETDVMDTWATSSVTPEIATNWAHKGEYDFEYKNELFDLRPQAHDIIRTWLFYTLTKSMLHFKRTPWKNVMISGHAQDPSGRKMSKSLGNIIEPQEMIKKYSADALRFWAAGSKLGDDLPFQEKDLLTGQKFSTKLWNASKFALMHLEDYDNSSSIVCAFDAYLLNELATLIENCTKYFEEYEYSKVKTEVEVFFWHTLCDNYLEIVKDRLYNPTVRGVKERKSAQYALNQTLLCVLKLSAPIMPHITEEIYQLWFSAKEKQKSIHLAQWPVAEKKWKNKDAQNIGSIGIDIINCVRKYKADKKLSLKESINELTIVGEKTLEGQVKHIEDDLKAVLNAKVIIYKGAAQLETDKYKVKIGIA